MTTFYSIANQTMIDLCLQSYGTTDLLVKFCNDNNVSSINYAPAIPQAFVYDETLVTDQRLNNYVFVTAIGIGDIGGDYYAPESGGGYYTSEDGGSIYVPE